MIFPRGKLRVLATNVINDIRINGRTRDILVLATKHNERNTVSMTILIRVNVLRTGNLRLVRRLTNGIGLPFDKEIHAKIFIQNNVRPSVVRGPFVDTRGTRSFCVSIVCASRFLCRALFSSGLRLFYTRSCKGVGPRFWNRRGSHDGVRPSIRGILR